MEFTRWIPWIKFESLESSSRTFHSVNLNYKTVEGSKESSLKISSMFGALTMFSNHWLVQTSIWINLEFRLNCSINQLIAIKGRCMLDHCDDLPMKWFVNEMIRHYGIANEVVRRWSESPSSSSNRQISRGLKHSVRAVRTVGMLWIVFYM